jgi:octaprenyl-diphosphate synthase
VAQQSDDFANQLGQVWQDIGLGFQIADDVGNIEGTIAGKEQGDDIIEGKKSLAVILFNQSYNSQTFKLLHYIKQAKTGNKEAVKQACQLLQQSKVIDEAKTLGNHYLEEGHKKLKQLLPFNNYSTLLFNLVAKLKG